MSTPRLPELKPCPFCGSPDIGWWGDVPCCDRCSAMGPTDGIDDTRENMAEKWNRRSLPDPSATPQDQGGER